MLGKIGVSAAATVLLIVDVGQGKHDDLPQEPSKPLRLALHPLVPGPRLTRAVVRLTGEDDERPWREIG